MSKKLTFVSRELELTFNEKLYKLRYPSVSDIKGYRDNLHAEGAVELDVITDMLSTLGLPKAVVEKMEIPFIEEIVKELTAAKK